MEDSKRVHKFYGRPAEDFHLWCARTEAALEAKEVLYVVTDDVMSGGDPDEEILKSITTARAILIQGLGDRPLRLCLSEKENPHRMWIRLRDRYAVSNTATRVQLQTKLSRMSYQGQSMPDYIDGYEEIFNRLGSMESPISEDLQVAMLLASFGDKNKSPYVHIVASLQSVQENLSWETAIARLIREFEESLSRTEDSSGAKKNESIHALNTTSSGNYPRKKFGKGSPRRLTERRRCYRCQKLGHIARHCQQKTKQKFVDQDSENNHREHALGAAQNAQLLMATTDEKASSLDESRDPFWREDDVNSDKSYLQESYGRHEYYAAAEAFEKEISLSARNVCTAVASYDKRSENTEFILDSGASDHMVRNSDWLQDAKPIEPRAILLGNGSHVFATHVGKLPFETVASQRRDHYNRQVFLSKALLVPDLKSNLLSCASLCDDGYQVNFNAAKCVGIHDGIIQFQGQKLNGIFKIRCNLIRMGHANAHISQPSINTGFSTSMDLWHRRLGHAHPERIRRLIRTNAVRVLDISNSHTKETSCSDCIKGKQAKESLIPNKFRATSKCVVIHTDVCGPMSVTSHSGAWYFVCFVDDYSGHITVIPIARKSDVRSNFICYSAWLERRYDCSIKRLHSDNGGEFIALAGYLKEKGIEQTMTPSYSPNLNGVAERANRTVVEAARAMLEHSSMPRKFWAEALVYAAKIQNMFHCPRDSKRTSHELMTEMKPNVGHFRVFGCLAWNHIPKDLRKKLDAKSELGMVLNCLENKQYKLWIPSRGVAVISRDVRIIEDQFPARKWKGSAFEEDVPLIQNDLTTVRAPIMRQETVSDQHPIGENREMQPVLPPTNVEAEQNITSRTATKGSHPSSEDLDLLTHYPQSEEQTDASEEMTGNENVGSRYPRRDRTQTTFYTPGSAETARMISKGSSSKLPRTVQEAMMMDDAQEWKKAIDSELDSLRKHQTWVVTKRNEMIKPLSTRLVFTRKLDEDGNVIRLKARLVVHGYLQGSVDETFAPVVDFTSIRVTLALAIERGYVIHQKDIRTAFLHGKIDGDVYITAPEGLDLCSYGQVLKLKRGLYGLKQASKLSHDTWLSVMKKLGFRRLHSDSCIFVKGTIVLLVYVDDIILVSDRERDVLKTKTELGVHLDVKDLGRWRSFLGVQFIRERKNAWLTQRHYIVDILRRFGMENCKPATTPMNTGAMKEFDENKRKMTDRRQYHELIGCLLFLATRTRPDICAAVSTLCRYAAKPTETHVVHLKRVFRYLQGTKHFGLRISARFGSLHGFCDSDWAGDRKDRKSTTGILLKLGDTSVIWRTTKQTSVALSSTEAEYVAMSEATKLIIWIRSLLTELGSSQDAVIDLNVDNRGAIVWGKDGIRHAKHISIRRNFVRENIKDGALRLTYCSTELMTADILTKPLLNSV